MDILAASSADQVTLWELLDDADQTAWAAGNPKRFADLRPGDVVARRLANGLVSVGWCVAPDGDGGWEVLAEDRPWPPASNRSYPGYSRYFPLWPGAVWRWLRHDADWAVHVPFPDAVAAWLTAQAPTWPRDRLAALYHLAQGAWPHGVDPAWRQAVDAAFTATAITCWPLADWLRHNRRGRGAGTRIWSCPPRVVAAITETVWPLPGPERLEALRALRWTRAEHFGDADVSWPDRAMAFNRTPGTIYDGYLRWAVAHAATPRQLLEVCDAWGSNPIPEEAP